MRSIQCQVGEYLVKFFGSWDFYWLNLGRCFTFAEGDGPNGHIGSGSSIQRVFGQACEQAKIAYREVERLKSARLAKPSTNKYNFQMIRTNKPVGAVTIPKMQLDDVPKCDCNPNQVAPCGSDTECMNRMLKYECHPAVCSAGPRCQNQRFMKREYPKQEPMNAGQKGWGLKAQENIMKGLLCNFWA